MGEVRAGEELLLVPLRYVCESISGPTEERDTLMVRQLRVRQTGRERKEMCIY